MALLELRDVERSFRRRRAADKKILTDVDLDIEEGDFVCLVGESGCGKTTLLNIIGGLMSATGGTIRLDGAPVTRPTATIGVVFQQYAAFPWMTVRENIAYGLKTRRAPRAEIQTRTDHFIELVGLRGYEDAYPKELSGGMSKRVDVARAYANNPRLLLMDEPFGALDDMTKKSMQNELLRLRRTENTTIVFVTHDLDEAVFLGNRIVILQRSHGTRSSVKDVIASPFENDEARLAARSDPRFEPAVEALRALISADKSGDA